jgi:hypothetical protein
MAMTDTEMLLDAIKGYQHGRIGMSRDVREAFTALLRRDWSVRVLDAVPCCCSGWEGPAPAPEQARNGTYFVFVMESHWGHDPDAARHAAALAVLPSLPADVRAELGECP